MIVNELISKREVSLAEVKQLIGDRKKDKELKYEQEQSAKYTKEFAKIPLSKAEKMVEELTKLNVVTERLAIKVIDLMPEGMEILEMLPVKDEEESKETLQQVLEIIKKNLKRPV